MTSLVFPETFIVREAIDPRALTADPTALNRARPRMVRLTSVANLARRILMIGTAVVLLLYGLSAGNELLRLRTLAATGRVAEGRVYATAFQSGRSGGYLQYFQFPAEGRYVAGYRSVLVGEYTATRTGDTVTVTYPPGRPEDYVVGRVDRARIVDRARSHAGGVLLLTALFGFLILWLEAGIRSQLRLLHEGVAVTARVANVEQMSSNSGHAFRLVYRFTTAEGTPQEGSVPVAFRVRDNYVTAGADPTITVLYDPRDSRRNAPYAFVSLAELAA